VVQRGVAKMRHACAPLTQYYRMGEKRDVMYPKTIIARMLVFARWASNAYTDRIFPATRTSHANRECESLNSHHKRPL
jgi:hypothetical protein